MPSLAFALIAGALLALSFPRFGTPVMAWIALVPLLVALADRPVRASHNCPYKVRYFNWYAYAKKAFPEPLNLQLNPEVTDRARGVMEKCTFCVQRIRAAQHQAKLGDREVLGGDVVTAGAQACPSGAITFGNIKDPASRVARAAGDARGYHVLEEINVRPSVTYLAKVLHGAEA